MKHYNFIDYATQGYIALVGVLILFFHADRVPHWGWLLAAHGLGLALFHLLIQTHSIRPQNRLLKFLHAFYPLLLLTGFYRESAALNQMFFHGYLDPLFFKWDAILCGTQPGLAFMQRFPYLALSEFFYASYFSYYLMIGGVGLALYFRDQRQFFHYLSVTCFCFYCCYLCYIFLPVVGPYIVFEDIPDFHLPAELKTAELLQPDIRQAVLG